MAKRIGIIDADLLDKGTRFPNLALMKIAGYNRDAGNDVCLIEDYDELLFNSTNQEIKKGGDQNGHPLKFKRMKKILCLL